MKPQLKYLTLSEFKRYLKYKLTHQNHNIFIVLPLCKCFSAFSNSLVNNIKDIQTQSLQSKIYKAKLNFLFFLKMCLRKFQSLSQRNDSWMDLFIANQNLCFFCVGKFTVTSFFRFFVVRFDFLRINYVSFYIAVDVCKVFNNYCSHYDRQGG